MDEMRAMRTCGALAGAGDRKYCCESRKTIKMYSERVYKMHQQRTHTEQSVVRVRSIADNPWAALRFARAGRRRSRRRRWWCDGVEGASSSQSKRCTCTETGGARVALMAASDKYA